MESGSPEGVLITGVYGSGKSSVAAEIAYLLETRGDRYALLDLDYLGWAASGAVDRASEVRMMLANLTAVAANYRQAGIDFFVLAYFVRDGAEVQGVRDAVGVPLRVVRLTVPLADIQRRLAADVTSGRLDDLRESTLALAASEGNGVEDVAVGNDRTVGAAAREVMRFIGWL